MLNCCYHLKEGRRRRLSLSRRLDVAWLGVAWPGYARWNSTDIWTDSSLTQAISVANMQLQLLYQLHVCIYQLHIRIRAVSVAYMHISVAYIQLCAEISILPYIRVWTVCCIIHIPVCAASSISVSPTVTQCQSIGLRWKLPGSSNEKSETVVICRFRKGIFRGKM